MSYRVICDSCTDLTPDFRAKENYVTVPLTVSIDDYSVVDDYDFDQHEFLKRVRASKNVPKSACPSPEAFREAIDCREDDVFLITLSSHLSGSFNAARMGREMYMEEHEDSTKNILVIDSESASSGQLALARRIYELYEKGLSFSEVKEAILKFRDEQLTYFILDTLDHLKKNGRMSGLELLIANTLNIKPVMQGNHGVIEKAGQARGLNNAYRKMAQLALSKYPDYSQKELIIAHTNCPERAQQVKEIFTEAGTFRDIIIIETNGVSTLYAADGGIIVAIC